MSIKYYYLSNKFLVFYLSFLTNLQLLFFILLLPYLIAGRIGKVESVSYNPGHVEPLRRYTIKELKAKLKQIQAEQDEFYEIHSYLAQFKNPNNLSFKELIKLPDTNPEEEDYILNIKSLKK